MKEKNAFWLLNPANKIESLLLTLFFLLLPTQLGKHFWPDFSHVSGIRVDYLSPTLYLTDVLLGLVLLSWFIRVLRQKHFHFKKSVLTPLFLIFIFFACNISFSSRPLLSLYGTVKYIEFGLLGWYLASSITRHVQLQFISLLIAINSLFESFLAIAQYVQQGSLNGIFYWFGERMFTGSTPGIANVSIAGDLILRPYGTFSHPNVLAGYLLLSLLFVWFFLRKAASKSIQIVSAISLVIISIALLLTFSRAAIALWVLLLATLLVRLLLTRLQSKKEKVIATGLLLVVFVGLLFLPISHELITRFTQTSFGEESFTERAELTGAAVSLITSHLWIGVGLDNFLPSLAPLQKPLPLGLYIQPVHNIFLLVTAETGVLGVLLFLELLFASIQNSIRMTPPLKQFLLFSLGAIFLTGMVDHYWLTLQQGQLLFTIVLGLSWTPKIA